MANTRLMDVGLVLALTCTLACKKDDGGPGASDSEGSTGGSTGSGDEGNADSSAGQTESGSGTVGSTGTADSTADAGSTGDEGTTGDVLVDCANLPAGPFTATPVFDTPLFSGSEDLAFDGQGQVVAKNGGALVAATAAGEVQELVANIPGGQTLGLRYRSNGELVAAQGQAVIGISPEGAITTIANNVGANGIYVDADDNVWVTATADDTVLRIDAENGLATIVGDAQFSNNPNGVLYDAQRERLFFTNYAVGETGTIRSVAIADGAAVGDPLIAASITDATNDPGLDGLALDACGNLYVVDQRNNQIYRVRLDEEGQASGEPESLLDAATPTSIANAQFGSGEGWSETSLYAIGTDGVLYAVDVGVPGAPYTVPAP